MKKYLPIILLLIAVFIAVLTRFYKLGVAPAGLYLDEAGQGYSAYSILKTGKDEFGKSYPIVFRNFTDFKTPVYIYIIVPLINIFGLTKFTVRLPSAVFSILTFPFLYLLVRNLTPKNLLKNGKWKLASLTAILLAVSPWHILFGRTNFEVNVSLFFLIAGLYFFYKSIGFPSSPESSSKSSNIKNAKQFKPWFLIPTALMFSIAIPSYHSQRVVTPLIMLILSIRYRKEIFSKPFRKPLIIGAIIGLFILLPTLSVMRTPGFLKRASGLNIFTNESGRPAGYLENYEGFLEPILNNQLFLSTKEFAGLYVSYFSPRNMFILGDSGPRSSFPALSTFFVWQFPFYVYGLYILIKKKDLGELRFLTLSLLLISPIPAAVTRDPYSTIRSLVIVIPQTIIISLGIIYFYRHLILLFCHPELISGSNKRNSKILNLFQNDKIKKCFNLSLIPFVFILVIYSITKLWSSVIILNEHYRAEEWNYGWEEVASTIKTLDPSLPIIVDNARSEPYSQLLFFLKFDPEKFQQENFEVTPNEYYTNLERNKEKIIGNIVTRPINWEKDLLREQYLIGDALSISDNQIKEHDLELIKDITYPNWSIAFRIVKVNL